ncbi:M23 family metallopeptidase [bacterium]|nr:M23 family metallopeptidase [bacterium]
MQKKLLIAIISSFLIISSSLAQELDASPVRDNPTPKGTDASSLTRISNGVKVEPENVGQGKTLAIYFESPQTLKDLKAEFLGKEIRFYETGKNRYRAILGIPLITEPGRYEILFRIKTEEGLKIEWKEAVQIEKSVFKKEVLSIPPEKSSHLTSKYLGKEGERIREAGKKEEAKQFWEGRFILPAEGRISSPFGAYRVYDKGQASWRHRGVDIANKEGIEVFASNSGIVVLSEDMRVHGGTIIINHGQGVFSIFSHLKERLVKKGKEVERGQLIGTMGRTGLATGSHLHWGLCVSGTVVDPLEWTKRKIKD